jgi:hypothetical protein
MATRRWDARVLGTVLSVGTFALCGVVTAGAARADTVSYLNKLHDAGINTPGGDGEMKEWGWEVCQLFLMGVPADKVRDQAVYNSGNTPQYGMSIEQADDIVNFAVSDLCNDHK